MGENDPASIGEDERDYLLGRATAHRQLAALADTAGARSIHLRFESLYEERAAAIELVDRNQS